MMMPLLEDAASIQMVYMQVLGAILYNEVATRKGRAMLSAIHGAQRNLKVVKREMATVEKPRRGCGVGTGAGAPRAILTPWSAHPPTSSATKPATRGAAQGS
jgi:hypothetical protein